MSNKGAFNFFMENSLFFSLEGKETKVQDSEKYS
jgi:hypothetical protein